MSELTPLEYYNTMVTLSVAWNKAYHVDDAPMVSDAEYDELKREITRVEKEHGFYHPLSPTKVVGGAVDKTRFTVVKHKTPMISLQDVFDMDTVNDFTASCQEALGTDKIQYVIEPKIDGLALSLHYVGGKLVRALTRGNGDEGEDVTHTAVLIKGVPTELSGDYPSYLEVRGEAFMKRSVLKRLNEEYALAGKKPLKNCRNSAAGAVRALTTDAVIEREIAFLAYSVMDTDEDHFLAISKLAEYGIHTNQMRMVKCVEARHLEELDKQRKEFDYDTDGAVIKLNRMDHRKQMGSRSSTPRWAIAYKYPSEVGSSTLNSVDFQVGRTGQITPVAKIGAVTIGGVEITSVSLHNFDEMARLGVTYGCTVEVTRAGDVIPQITQVLDTNGGAPIVPTTVCPSCESFLVNDCCINKECKGKLKRQIEYMVGRDCLDIKGMGTETINALVDSGTVTSVGQLLDISLADFEASGVTSKANAGKIIANTSDLMNGLPLWRIINSAGIEEVGKSTAKSLAKAFGSLAALKRATFAELNDVENVGKATVDFISSWFGENEDVLEMLSRIPAVDVVAPVSIELTNRLTNMTGFDWWVGKKVIISGSFKDADRTVAQNTIKKLIGDSGKLVSSVKAADICLFGDKPSSNKVNEATLLSKVVVTVF